MDYYKEACRALENSDTASMLGKIQKDWKKLVQMKIYYFAAIAHVGVFAGPKIETIFYWNTVNIRFEREMSRHTMIVVLFIFYGLAGVLRLHHSYTWESRLRSSRSMEKG